MSALRSHDQALFQIQVELASFKKNRQSSGKTLERILEILETTELKEGPTAVEPRKIVVPSNQRSG